MLVFYGCFRDASGNWFHPTGPDAPRIPGGGILTDAEKAQTAELRRRLEADLAGFEAALDATPLLQPIENEDGMVDRSLKDTLDRMERGEYSKSSPIWEFIVDDYIAVFGPYFQNTEHQAFRQYTVWWSQRRTAAFPDTGMPLVGDEFRENLREGMRVEAWPWPWELRDPVTIDLYLEWALENRRV